MTLHVFSLVFKNRQRDIRKKKWTENLCVEWRCSTLFRSNYTEETWQWRELVISFSGKEVYRYVCLFFTTWVAILLTFKDLPFMLIAFVKVIKIFVRVSSIFKAILKPWRKPVKLRHFSVHSFLSYRLPSCQYVFTIYLITIQFYCLPA